jgi:hypothetical protein
MARLVAMYPARALAASKFRASLNSPTGAMGLGPNASDALQILSLHLPSFVGGSPIAPEALLRPRLGGFVPDTAVQAQTTGVPAGAPPSTSPSPSLRPWAPTDNNFSSFSNSPQSVRPGAPTLTYGEPAGYRDPGRFSPTPTIPTPSGPTTDPNSLGAIMRGLFPSGPSAGQADRFGGGRLI